MTVLTLNQAIIRPSVGQPLFRNSNTVGAIDKDKSGYPGHIIRLTAGDYVSLIEMVNGSLSPTTVVSVASGATPFTVADFPSAGSPLTLISPTGISGANGESSIDCVFFSAKTGKLHAIGHIGGNTGPRQVFLWQAPPSRSSFFTPGAWTPVGVIIPIGSTGAWNDTGMADACCTWVSGSTRFLLARGWSTGGTNASRIGLFSSTDDLTWTPFVGNPVLAPQGTGFEQDAVLPGGGFIDANGRVHFWYSGFNSGTVQYNAGYGHSDDNGQTWTRNATAVWTQTGSASDPDQNMIDCPGVGDDGWKLVLTEGGFNASLGGSRFEGRVVGWIPKPAAVTPAKPGRVFTAGTDRLSGSSTNKILGQTVYTVLVDLQMPPAKGTAGIGNYRMLFYENVTFNIQILVAIDGNGFVNFFNAGTSNGVFIISSGTRWDDDTHRYLRCVRTAAGAFAAFIGDGTTETALGTSSLTPVGDSGTPTLELGGSADVNQNSGNGVPNHALQRRVTTIAGYAATMAEAQAWFNGGDVQASAVTFGGGTVKTDIKVGNTTSETAGAWTLHETATNPTLVEVAAPANFLPPAGEGHYYRMIEELS